MSQIGTALVLAGGGARGAFQAGCLEVLTSRGIKPTLVVGTSVGGLNGAFYAQGDANRLYETWMAVASLPKVPLTSASSILRLVTYLGHTFGLRSWVSAPAGIVALVSSAAMHGMLEGVTVPDWDALRSFLEQEVKVGALMAPTAPELHLTIAETDSPLLAALRSQMGGSLPASWLRPRDCRPDEVIRLLLASAALPLVFPSVRLQGRNYVDGGVADNEPIARALALGATSLVVIGTHRSSKLSHATHDVPLIHLLDEAAEDSLISMVDLRPELVEIAFERGRAVTKTRLHTLEAFFDAAVSHRQSHVAVDEHLSRASSNIAMASAAVQETQDLLRRRRRLPNPSH